VVRIALTTLSSLVASLLLTSGAIRLVLPLGCPFHGADFPAAIAVTGYLKMAILLGRAPVGVGFPHLQWLLRSRPPHAAGQAHVGRTQPGKAEHSFNIIM
jgi:hypothetical protein